MKKKMKIIKKYIFKILFKKKKKKKIKIKKIFI